MAVLSGIVAALRTREVSAGDRAEARLAMLDTLGCIRSGMANIGQVREMVEASGTTGPGARAMILGTAAHALDFDDYEELGSTHPSAAIIGALLALAETTPAPFRAMEDAWVAGYETILTFGKALGYGHYLAGWHSSGTLGGIGAAAASARLLDLGEAGTVTALSLAMTQASGMKVQFGTPTKPLHCGLAARTGVEAALLARAGMVAARDPADAFLAMYGTKDSPGWAAAMPPPKLADHPPCRKLWPSCAYTHRTIEAAERIADRPAFDVAQIERGRIAIAAPYLAVAGIAQPGDANEARFSTAFCAATTLLDGGLEIASFEESARSRPAVARLLSRIETVPYALPDGVGDVSPEAPDTLSVTLKDGTVLTETIARLRGSPGKPLDAATILDKYRSCAGTEGSAFLARSADAAFAPPA